MDAKVVVEGIETFGELSAAVEAGADYCQGFLLARPALPPPPVTRDSYF
jgi:EAL domain-containing protein (putative c-di-GMP-specific phosphodiesterase class I)